MALCCCFLQLYENEQAVLFTPTSRKIIDGPVNCQFFQPIYTVKKQRMVSLKLNEQIMIKNLQDATKHRYVTGPLLVKIKDPWEEIVGNVTKSEILDQDDYIIVSQIDGSKKMIQGPCVWTMTYGDKVEGRYQSIQVPVNHYMIVKDKTNNTDPVQHIPGPVKHYLGAYQTVEKNVGQGAVVPQPKTNPTKKWVKGKWVDVVQPNITTQQSVQSENYFPCININEHTAIHLMKIDGNVELMATPSYYMPKVGERVVQYVERIVLLSTDFCVLKAPNGSIEVKNGINPRERAFFLKPFYSFVTFHCDTEVKILSTLPTFMAHQFQVRTKDNVLLDLDLRICYKIVSVENFAMNPIENFFPNIKNLVQSKLLDRFATCTNREFMSTFASIAQASVDQCSSHYLHYGIEILDVQILNFTCSDSKTMALLMEDIEQNVRSQNELREKQNDIAIQEQSNVVKRTQKDLEVQMFTKDNEVRLEKKKLENTIRIKEMEVEIIEEQKRTVLLEVKRGNELVEAEFAGKGKGHEFNEFVRGIDPNLTGAQKLAIWKKQIELEQAAQVYSKMGVLNMLPPEEDMALFKFGTGEAAPSKSRVEELPPGKFIKDQPPAKSVK